MNLVTRIENDIKAREKAMSSIVETVDKIENNYQAVQHINRRIQDINEGCWAYGFLSDDKRAAELLHQLNIQRRVLRMRKMLLNRLAVISQQKLLKADDRIDTTYELTTEVNKVFFPEAIMTKAG